MHQTTQRLVNSIKRTFNAAEICVLARTQKLPVVSIKADQPIAATSHCVYQFTCNCDESYIGRTERCLISRVKKHLPKWVQISVLRKNDNVVETRKQPASAVARHVLTTGHVIDPMCAFRILLRRSNPRFLRFAEVVAINPLKPTFYPMVQNLPELERNTFESYVQKIVERSADRKRTNLLLRVSPKKPRLQFPEQLERYPMVQNLPELERNTFESYVQKIVERSADRKRTNLLLRVSPKKPRLQFPEQLERQIDLEVQFENFSNQLQELCPSSELNSERSKSTLVTIA
ncbi:uncharacterized protein DEA37_0012719 [Paragonimus westermani]|uniref:Uncharacterized protein n=1 Tax=Paragonimus westermani TaxID=34504 RepID=A0A5J4N5N0_9TREM|nr:uncharacterized protein DEA37_0012719 [Paragonimus westermani]